MDLASNNRVSWITTGQRQDGDCEREAPPQGGALPIINDIYNDSLSLDKFSPSLCPRPVLFSSFLFPSF